MLFLEGQNLELPLEIRFNQFVCMEFLSVGVQKLRAAQDAHSQEGDMHTLLAGGAVGMACYAQGLELLLKAICRGRGLAEPKGNHKIVELFELFSKDPVFLRNSEELFQGKGLGDPTSLATSVVQVAQDSFMLSRYFGYKREATLVLPDADKAAVLVVALTATYFVNYAQAVADQLGCEIDFLAQENCEHAT